jgi:hypothetical protein
MFRLLPVVLSLAFVVGVVALAMTSAFEGDALNDLSSRPTPTLPNCSVVPDACDRYYSDSTPITCPAPDCNVWPGRTPPPGGDPTPVAKPFVVNGVEIPIPPGAESMSAVGSGPADWEYFTHTPRRASQIAFTTEGWIYGIEIRPEDLDDFAPTLDALAEAADPVVISGKSFRVPRGAVYHEPFFAPRTSAYAGPPEESPSLHFIKRGNSIISFDDSGKIVVERIANEDAADFRPVTDALSASSR